MTKCSECGYPLLLVAANQEYNGDLADAFDEWYCSHCRRMREPKTNQSKEVR